MLNIFFDLQKEISNTFCKLTYFWVFTAEFLVQSSFSNQLLVQQILPQWKRLGTDWTAPIICNSHKWL